LVLPDLCLGASRVSEEQATTEIRWSAFSAGQASKLYYPLGGLLGGAMGAAFAKTKGLSGFAVYYVNEVQATGGFLAAATPDVVDEIFSVMPDDKIIPLPS
jgi:hypothetical protein